MANEVRIKVVADKPDTSGFDAVNKELKDTGAQAKVAEAGLGDLEKQAKKTGTEAKSTGDSFKDLGDNMTESDRAATQHTRSLSSVGDQLKKLDGQIAEGREALHMFAGAFADTNDAAQKLDIKKAMDKVQKDLTDNTKNRKILFDAMPKLDPKDTQGFFKSVNASISEAAASGGSLGPAGIALGVGIALAAGPPIGAALAAAAIGAVGVGGIAGGVMLAADNPAVAAAANKVSKNFGNTIKASATDWFQGPILQTLPVVTAGLHTLAISVGGIFKNLAPSLGPLVTDLLSGVNKIGGAFENVSGKAGPVLASLGASLKLILGGVGDFFNEITNNSDGAATSLLAISGAIADILKLTGKFISFLELTAEHNPILNLMAKHYADAADASRDFSDATGKATEQMTVAARAAEGERDALVDLSNQLKAESDPVFAVITAQGKLAAAHDAATKAAKEGKKGTADYQKASRDAAGAAIDLEGAVGKLGASFDGKLTPELRATLEAAGLTKGEINSLAGQFAATKKSGDSFAKKYQADAAVNGVGAAKRQLTQLEQQAKAYAKVWTATMITHFIQTGKPSSTSTGTLMHGLATGGIKGAATGMVAGDLTWVGEQGPELVNLPTGSTVHSAGDSQRMMNTGSAHGDGQPWVVNVTLDGHVLATAMIEPQRSIVRQLGAGSVQRMYGVAGAVAA